NFPIAIPCGGICAALAAGNTVILKPASDTVLVAHVLCQCFWRAGISRHTLQMLPCRGATEGQQLASHDGVDAVVLTGGTETALQMLAAKPSMHLLAETGGKNATIVTALADRDQAIKHVLHSAFSHSGQKCSATSLLILEAEVYDDPQFRRALCDAVESLPVGAVWQQEHKMGPLIRPPSGALERAIKELERGEAWAVMPQQRDDNPHLYSPGVKWNVQPGSFTHLTELFGPVLGVMKAQHLDEAMALVNATGYGLTSGLESLDDREQALWRETIRAGNLYINRPTTGAIVLRQPFGGMNKSSIGPGIKAGGPNYVASLIVFHDPDKQPSPLGKLEDNVDHQLAALVAALENDCDQHDWLTAHDIDWLYDAIARYAAAWRDEFSRDHDSFRLIGQDNLRRYLPAANVRIRADAADRSWEVLARMAAAKTVGSRITISEPPGERLPHVALLDRMTESWAGAIEFLPESNEQLAEVIRQGRVDRVRFASPDRVPDVVRSAAAAAGFYLADEQVHRCGRLELLHYVQEQSISHDYHRYGNLVDRADEARADTL
ncbi:MAG: aldehyde dehydrogenase family protein, partial [Planctomycetales bacterium]|nr:aldehyde dehydrogenase family protein [Planctomycetales bacterium]